MAEEKKPERKSYPGFVHRIGGGYTAGGIDYPACSITGEPCHGMFASGFVAAVMMGDDGKVGAIPIPSFYCKAGKVKDAVEAVAAMVRRSARGIPTKAMIKVDFSWFVLPDPDLAKAEENAGQRQTHVGP